MVKNGPTIKIFISAHKPSKFLKGDLFQPIKVGAINNTADIPEAISDDTKDNISKLNPKFCELTAQYWAWKNTNYDYYGFFHYRRYFSFNLKKFPTDPWGSVVEEKLNNDSIKKYNLDEEHIEKLVQEYDIILPQKRNVTTMPESSKNVREQYTSSGSLHAKDLEIMLDVLKEKYPDYIKYATNYLNGKITYFNNMFIMKKSLFDSYCKWLFDILFECDKRINYNNYSTEAIRTPGHLAERLFNIYLLKLLDDNKNIKVKELQTVFFNNTNLTVKPEPFYKKNNIPVVLSANDYYIPYVATLISSIIKNSSIKSNYDILILNKDISSKNQETLERLIKDNKNINVRFVDISEYDEKFKNLFTRGHFSIETWYRLIMPEILIHYDKVLYLDSDLVVNDDISKLYNTNIKDYLLAACYDPDTAGLYNGYLKSKKAYMDEVIKLQSPYDYFQAGVILFNLKKFREIYTTNEMLKLASSRNWELLDQDVLNVLAKDKVKYLPMKWNVMYDWQFIRKKDIIGLAPKNLSDAYEKARKNPKIIHYAGPDKPWNDPSVDFADYFWKYAKTSGYYEELLNRLNLKTKQQRRSPKNFIKNNIIKKLFPLNSKRRMYLLKIHNKLKR